MLDLLFVALCYEAICFISYLVLFFLVFFSPFSIVITLLGDKRANLSVFLTFVRFALVWFVCFIFFLVSRKGSGL